MSQLTYRIVLACKHEFDRAWRVTIGAKVACSKCHAIVKVVECRPVMAVASKTEEQRKEEG